MLNEEKRFSEALQRIARNQELKAYVQHSKELFPLFQKGAKRFVAGESRHEGIERVKCLYNKGYQVSLEFIGENTSSKQECLHVKDEFISLINALGKEKLAATVSFDLSHIGLMISDEFALTNLEQLAKQSAKHNIQLMISMEESQKTDRILSIYKKITYTFSHVGITLQAHLNRSADDLLQLLETRGKIRLVKGAYREPEGISMPRSEELNNRYIEFVSTCINHNHQLSIATHDEQLLTSLRENGLLHHPNVEIEMLDGVRPDLLKSLKDDKIPTKVYVTYGNESYLYVTHRIAEYPPNIYTFIADIIREESEGDRVDLY